MKRILRINLLLFSVQQLISQDVNITWDYGKKKFIQPTYELGAGNKISLSLNQKLSEADISDFFKNTKFKILDSGGAEIISGSFEVRLGRDSVKSLFGGGKVEGFDL